MKAPRSSSLLTLLLLAGAPLPGGAQLVAPSVATGVAIPTGGAGAHRGVGVTLRAGLTIGQPSRLVRLRFDLEGSRIPDDGASPGLSWTYGELAAFGGYASLLVGRSSPSWLPYAVVGGGAQRMWVADRVNPYKVTPALRFAVGTRRPFRQWAWFAEAGPHVAVTDYGSTSETAAVYWPVVLGIEF